MFRPLLLGQEVAPFTPWRQQLATNRLVRAAPAPRLIPLHKYTKRCYNKAAFFEPLSLTKSLLTDKRSDVNVTNGMSEEAKQKNKEEVRLMCVMMETTATDSGGFPLCVFLCTDLLNWTADQSDFSHRQVVADSTCLINQKASDDRSAVLTLLFTPHWPETQTLCDSPDKYRPPAAAWCAGCILGSCLLSCPVTALERSNISLLC